MVKPITISTMRLLVVTMPEVAANKLALCPIVKPVIAIILRLMEAATKSIPNKNAR